jgi:hypothetical protein
MNLHQLLTLYTWFGLGILIAFLALIARFYERLSGQRTYYRWFAVPAIAFGGAAVRFSHLDRMTGDAWGELLLLCGGLSLAALCVRMYRLMTSGR